MVEGVQRPQHLRRIGQAGPARPAHGQGGPEVLGVRASIHSTTGREVRCDLIRFTVGAGREDDNRAVLCDHGDRA